MTDDRKSGTADAAAGGRCDIATVMRRASGQLADLLQCEPGSVSAVKGTGEGWSADVEVVELAKVPDTMSVMATYHVELDAEGRLVAYERVRRYARGQIDRR
ncbi:gas vesicle protein [Streptomyces sp. NK15101]|uniref:gas vesicle protein GvpO n=1 Tax=Streptomyces sp. NK15101 TaxID=2873261 RepID=UPI001CED73B9|nr:gas vesicle protein [Streptomyces sp. NK15101]